MPGTTVVHDHVLDDPGTDEEDATDSKKDKVPKANDPSDSSDADDEMEDADKRVPKPKKRLHSTTIPL